MRDNIPGFPGYFVSRSGVIYCNKLRGSTIGTTSRWYRLKLQINHGYPVIILWDGDGNSKHFKVHRLVAKTYIPNPENKPCVCHKDNNRANNSVDNLYWGTYKENNKQCISDGRGNRSCGTQHWSHKKRGESHPNSKVVNREKIYMDYVSGRFTQYELSKLYRVSQGTISKTIKRFSSDFRAQAEEERLTTL